MSEVVIRLVGVCAAAALVALLEDLDRLGVTYSVQIDSHPSQAEVDALPAKLRERWPAS